ncbi:hypothetical protein HAX54_022631 [Datura stramonium]|uniref:Mediator complex subunit 15 KIX domain-containing protein n=1 Tax=Datura stramonium TaxID=4076 RepID=A0ABS8UX60_DATST|nr:hypothetical protein [Datura stramonium]
MDVNNWRSAARARARARFQAKWDEGTATAGPSAGITARSSDGVTAGPSAGFTAGPSDRIAAGPSAGVTARPYAGVTAGPSDGIAAGTYAGGATGPIDSAAWRTQLPPGFRQMIINKMMETLQRCFPVNRQGGVEELYKISVSSEEQIFMSATSQQDYRLKVSSKMLTMQPNFGNPMTNYLHPNAAGSGQNVRGPEMTMEATSSSYEYTSGPEESDEKQTAEEDIGDVSKEDVVEEVVVTEEQNHVVGQKENVRVGDNEISCGLSSGAKFDERLAQVEERLEKMEAHSEKVERLLVDINKKLNYLVKMQDAEVSRDVKRPAKYTSSPWTGNGRSKRKHRVAEMIRQSCKHRRLGRGAIAQ